MEHEAHNPHKKVTKSIKLILTIVTLVATLRFKKLLTIYPQGNVTMLQTNEPLRILRNVTNNCLQMNHY